MTDTTVAAPADPVGTEIAVIEDTIRNRAPDYWRDEGMQSRYRDLLAARATGGRSPLPIPAAAKRRAEIERLIGNHGSEYWCGDRAEALQGEYLKLLAQENGAATTGGADESWRPTPAEARKSLDPALVAEFQSDGQFEPRLRAMQDTLVRIMATVGDKDAALALVSDFDHLMPARIKNAVLGEFSLPVPAFGAAINGDDIERFASTPEGKSLVGFWGQHAQRNLGILRARFDRMTGRLNAAERSQAVKWFNALSPAEAIAVEHALTARG